jgi:hypothetical protein
VRAREQTGDELRRAILVSVDTSVIGPFDRDDAHALIEQIDDVVDDMLHVASLVDLLRLDELPPDALEIADALCRAAEVVPDLMVALHDKRRPDAELQIVDRLESHADRLYRHALAELFWGGHPALDVIKWKDILDGLEHSMNGIERVAYVTHGIGIRQT